MSRSIMNGGKQKMVAGAYVREDERSEPETASSCRRLVIARLVEVKRLLDERHDLDARELLLDTMVELADLLDRRGLSTEPRKKWEEAGPERRARMSGWKRGLLRGTAGGTWQWSDNQIELRSNHWNVGVERALVQEDPWRAVDMICEAVRAGERVLRASLTERLVGVVQVNETEMHEASSSLSVLQDRLNSLALDLDDAGVGVRVLGLELRLGLEDYQLVTEWLYAEGRRSSRYVSMQMGPGGAADPIINLVNCRCTIKRDPHVPMGRGLVLVARTDEDPIPGR